MADVQVTCINKEPRNNTHERDNASGRFGLEMDTQTGCRFD